MGCDQKNSALQAQVAEQLQRMSLLTYSDVLIEMALLNVLAACQCKQNFADIEQTIPSLLCEVLGKLADRDRRSSKPRLMRIVE